MSIRIAFVGDIMPGGVLHGKPSGVSEEVKRYLDSFDFRIGTLECAIGNDPNFDPVKMSLKQDVIYAPDNDLEKLVELGIDCVSLANNHAFDLGENGLLNTITQLDRLGIRHCGAGMNIEEASRPVIVEKYGVKIGFLGFCDYLEETVGYVPVATHNSPGMNSLAGDYVEQVKQVSSRVDYLYLIIHWGIEHTFWPDERMLNIAKSCINAGASGIIGGHQHRVQPLVSYKDHPIFLGLGNFLFPPRYLYPPRPMYYPDLNEDTSQFPVTDGYPWVQVPTYKIWKRLGRIGAIASININPDKSQTSELCIVEMADHIKLVFPVNSPFNLRDKIESTIIRKSILNSGNYRIFSLVRLANRVYQGVKRRITQFLKK